MHEFLSEFDGRIGEAYDGESPNGSHINVVIAARGSATYASTIRTLASPSPGHVPFLACLGLGNVVRPATIVVNKITFKDPQYERFFYGAAQLGIAQGVMDAVKEGIIDRKYSQELALLVACWIDPEAEDETNIRVNTRNAMFNALRNALTPVSDSDEYIETQLKRYETAVNNFYNGK